MKCNPQLILLPLFVSILLLYTKCRSSVDIPEDFDTTKKDEKTFRNPLSNHISLCVPFYSLIEKHLLLKTGKRNQAQLTTFSLVGAYDYENYSVVTTEADGRYGKAVYCRFLDVDRMELTPATMSVVFPEITTYCCKRKGAYYMSITENISDDIVDMIPVVGRTDKRFKYNLSMCVKPMYGMDTKFLLFAEFVEHYKLQGVQHFYVYVKDLDNHTKKLLLHYEKNGEAEIIYFREKQDRPSIEWHLVGTQDCIHRSRQHSRYVIFADLDERILPLRNLTLKQLISNEMKSRPACGMMRFVTQWILKTGANPNIYEGTKTLIRHLLTLVYRNTSSPAPIGHTAKCAVDPDRVFLMWVHHLEIYFPTFEGYEVPPTDAVIRHYRDIASGDWARLYLPEVETFGPFSMNAYPADLMSKLFRNVKYVLDNVYRPFQ